MENKKQLVIVPPMSEPLQKLNEVLQGIAGDENIEISIIEDAKELAQFVGSAGQSLVAFSNAKKCATFLQENRFTVAKTHSKIILFTPNEIPAKTLAKFVKLGLTEAILEGSPPKTLLYKVKLLLRSIKTTTSQQDDKDQVVRSMTDGTAPVETGEATVKKAAEAEGESLSYLADEKAKFKKEESEEAVDYGGSLKGKNNFQEEALDTNWKSKLTTDDTTSSSDSDADRLKSEESSNIDKYYRGKNKTDSPIEEVKPEKKSRLEVDESEDLYGKTKDKNSNLEIEPADKPKRKSKDEEEENDFSFRSKKVELVEEEENDLEPATSELTDEEKAEAHQKELDELDAMIEAAKKRKAIEADNLGGHYKGRVSNQDETTDEDELKEEKEYDNSDLHTREKSLDLNLAPGEKEARQSRNDEEGDLEKDPNEGEVDNINNNMQSDKGSTDKINTNMIGEINKDANNRSARDSFDRDSEKKTSEEKADKDLHGKLEITPEGEDNLEKEKSVALEKAVKERESSETDLPLESADNDKLPTDKNSEADEASGYLKSKTSPLKLVDSDKESNREQNNEDDEDKERTKRTAAADIEKNNERRHHDGKADKIDTHYRGGDAKKAEQNWDGLDHNKQESIALEKSSRRESETAAASKKIDNGEITIDYRKLKEEFEGMGRSGQGSNSNEGSITSSNSLEDSEDAGSFKVIEINARGFIFSVDILNLLYQPGTKPIDFYKKIAEEIITHYKGYSLFYTYKTGEQKHTESFDSIMHFGDNLVPSDLKEWWVDTKPNSEFLSTYFNKAMTTWLCREIPNKSGGEGFWEDVELPAWASNELKDKKVELVFPYFDGVDRMGVGVVVFPQGINPSDEKSIFVTLELTRAIFLETIQRKLSSSDDQSADASPEPIKKNITSLFSGLFNRNKAS